MPNHSPHNAVNLKTHEWLAVAVLIVILGALSIMAYFTKGQAGDKDRSMPAFFSRPGKIEVLIEGAVTHPGIYYLPANIEMKAALALAEPLSDADLRRFNLAAHIKKGRIIHVPVKPMITVRLQGAIKNPGEITIPKGTRLMDLIPKVQFNENSAAKKINKKRKLKDGETITIY